MIIDENNDARRSRARYSHLFHGEVSPAKAHPWGLYTQGSPRDHAATLPSHPAFEVWAATRSGPIDARALRISRKARKSYTGRMERTR